MYHITQCSVPTGSWYLRGKEKGKKNKENPRIKPPQKKEKKKEKNEKKKKKKKKKEKQTEIYWGENSVLWEELNVFPP